MNPAVQNLVISLGAMQLAKRVPFDDPQVLTYVRIAYVATQVLVLGVYYYTGLQIKKKNDQTVLKYVEPNPMDPGANKLVTTTVRDYDLQETSKLMRAVYFGVAMMAFMHLYMKYTQPLFIQALMGLKTLYDAKPVAIHVLGKPAEGDLKRPFKAGGMFGAASDPQTDKAAIDEAEKKVGKKED
ncbi:inorganic phosphate transporter [Dichomitus squalens]|uniref:Inorganic phosphate transporter n=2 Tax=Dichomitus squalens TaxID=114155 RepID=A0A4Q9NJS5_9APHY|nr:inorganic phosphate transporter [Dichomitus squalens LYAD-421 SS1]EJF56012.1 inorganic phosphate transporter [Dichomitus squalens LYAD-421 SS1]TBU27547.1 inorganic phosphate transporter [Dichomitus squalens]TBU41570.1 inorganic phosphate transporter [Dichomitus squalens]TBU54709.1 inorganic phosphate transporter [Dichomitus squalens]